jgi:hypothetical protein
MKVNTDNIAGFMLGISFGVAIGFILSLTDDSSNGSRRGGLLAHSRAVRIQREPSESRIA